jgi:hypothetical protein
MRDAFKRLERLEQATKPAHSIDRCVITLIGAKDGRALPWNPTWAQTQNGKQATTRRPEETAEAFEARANAELSGFLIMIGCDPIPEDVRAVMA